MANRRMFSLDIVNTDAFLDLPISSQALYFHLGMRADDRGYVANARTIIKMIGSSVGDLETLINKKFVLYRDGNLILIKHFRANNYIQKDRFKETNYLEDFKTLFFDENDNYTESPTNKPCIQNVSKNVYKLDTQVSIGKVSIGNNTRDRACTHEEALPTCEEVVNFCKENKLNVNPKAFFNFYEATGWKVNGNSISNWKALARTWDSRCEDGKKNDPAWLGDYVNNFEDTVEDL